MGAWDIAITVIVCAAFAAVCGWLIYRKVKHKGGCCGCDFEGCGVHCQSGGASCPHCKKEDKN